MLYYIFLIHLFLSSYLQESPAKDLEIYLIEKSLKVQNDSLYYEVEVSNNTDSTIIFYHFKSFHEAITHEDYYLNTLNYPAGTAVFIKDKQGRFLEEDPLDLGKVTFKDVENLLARGRKAYIEEWLIMKPHSSVNIRGRMKLHYYTIENGLYYIYIIHYSGDNINNFVSHSEKNANEKKYNAITFYGRVQSNKVQLKVK